MLNSQGKRHSPLTQKISNKFLDALLAKKANEEPLGSAEGSWDIDLQLLWARKNGILGNYTKSGSGRSLDNQHAEENSSMGEPAYY